MTVTNLQTISLITPPGAVAFGWLLGGESFSVWSLAGGALVLAGVWMIFRKVQRAEMREECETALPQG
jgi:drug/metabolite transporter (DMT)-like permease